MTLHFGTICYAISLATLRKVSSTFKVNPYLECIFLDASLLPVTHVSYSAI